MSYVIERLDTFNNWLMSLRDRNAKFAITRRIDRVLDGNFGDHKAVGEGVSEMRVHVGQGYRVYYTIRQMRVVFLLCGGDKTSQNSDIQRAIQLAKEV